MLTLWEGRMRSGKTYSVVCEMMRYLSVGSHVVTNISLKLDAVREYLMRVYGHELLPDQVTYIDTQEQIYKAYSFARKGTKDCPSLIAIDEAHCFFSSRGWRSTESQASEFLWFLSQSSKLFVDVMFISQSIKNMDAQFTRLVSAVHRFRDMSGWRIPKTPFRWPFNQIMHITMDYAGEIIERAYPFKDKRIFALYDSYAIVRDFPIKENAQYQDSEIGIANRARIRRRRIVRNVLAAACVAVLCLGWFGRGWIADQVRSWRSSDQVASQLPGSVGVEPVKVPTIDHPWLQFVPSRITSFFSVSGSAPVALLWDSTRFEEGATVLGYQVKKVTDAFIWLTSQSDVLVLVHDVAVEPYLLEQGGKIPDLVNLGTRLRNRKLYQVLIGMMQPSALYGISPGPWRLPAASE